MDSTTFLHAITFLLAPLTAVYPSQVIDALHLSLLASLNRLDIVTQAQTFLLSPTAPPPSAILYALQTLKPFPQEYRVHWADWMMLLGQGNQLVLTIVSGCVQVTIRDVHSGQVTTKTIWSAALQNRTPSPWGSAVRSRSSATSSSDSSGDSESSRSSSPVVIEDIAVGAAENVLNDEDDVAFAPRLHHVTAASVPMVVGVKSKSLSAAAPEWFPSAVGSPARVNATHARAPSTAAPFPPSSPAPSARLAAVGPKRAAYQAHSRSSSRSSTMSSAPSLVSSYSSASGASSNASTATPTSLSASLASLSLRSKTPVINTHSTGGSHSVSGSSSASSNSSTSSGSPVPASPTPSDLSESADTTFYVDQSKDQQAVTEYECGKVGVLTGAVMLGVPKGHPKVVKVVGGKMPYPLRR